MSLSVVPGAARSQEADRPGERSSPQVQAALDGLCVPGVMNVAVQPIVRLADLVVVGYEALARVPLRPRHSPGWWLERAGEAGMRPRLEIACWRAIAEIGPPPSDGLLFLNVSPAVLAEPDLMDLREQLPGRLVIEVTEQEAVADYVRLRTDLVPWLTANARLAIDDTGAGHSSLRHVIELCPDFLKIDQALVTEVDKDRNRRALLRSLVAFAREVGCTVVAEGVETTAELETLRDAEVDLAQGFLFGRPARPWPRMEKVGEAIGRGPASEPTEEIGGRAASQREKDRLLRKLAGAPDATAACEATTEYLYRRGGLLPSVYLERRGGLRCIAQRGLWQVLDGMSATSGITGMTWSSGRPSLLADVRQHPGYLEAIPGVIAEACVPILSDGRSVGALNVESLGVLPAGTLELLTHCAALLGSRLETVGWAGTETAWQRAARASVTISGLAHEGTRSDEALDALRRAAGMDSAALVERGPDGLAVAVTKGPLALMLGALPAAELEVLCSLVDQVSSCYTANDATGRGFVGTESLRSQVRAVVVLPLRSAGRRMGTVVLAHSRPRALTSEDVEPLELVAVHLAAILEMGSLVARLRGQALEDGLTRLGNRTAFEEVLRAAAGTVRPRAAMIVDIDHFKVINDRFGHLVGDEALRGLAEALAAELPEIDVFRYGGDEFAVLTEDIGAAEANGVARSLCAAGNEVLARYGSSLTAGLAFDAEGVPPWELFARADAALLWAKRHARGAATAASSVPGLA